MSLIHWTSTVHCRATPASGTMHQPLRNMIDMLQQHESAYSSGLC